MSKAAAMLKMIGGRNVLALDLATKMGYYIRSTDHKVAEKNPSSIKFKIPTREKEFYEAVKNFVDKYTIDQIIFENACFQMGKAQGVFGGWVGILKLICQEKNIKCYPLDVMNIKKIFLGDMVIPLDAKGKKDWKAAVLLRCKDFGIDLGDDHDAADAFAVAYTWDTLQGINNKFNGL